MVDVIGILAPGAGTLGLFFAILMYLRVEEATSGYR